MQLNSYRMRLGAIAAGVLVIGLYLASGGSFGGERVIQLDFSMYPEVFEGCAVEIDGKVVGSLEPIGQARRNGFEVGKGRHTVRVVHPEIDCQPRTLTLEAGEKVRLLLDLQEVYDSEARVSRPVITLDG